MHCLLINPFHWQVAAMRSVLLWTALLLAARCCCGSAAAAAAAGAAGVGVNWGRMASQKLPASSVVEMLKANGISKVKLFESEPEVVNAFRGTNIELMVAIPNHMLQLMASIPAAARKWVRENVTHYLNDGHKSVNIKYVAVGNEPFLKAYNGTYLASTYPALKNIQHALFLAGLDHQVKATIPFNADVLSNADSLQPSAGIFRPEVVDEMIKVVEALAAHGSPFTVNIYPFLSLQQNPDFPKDFAFFDGTKYPVIDGNFAYTNDFVASYDVLVSALAKIGHPNMPIIVGEIGWPTDGDINANVADGERFNQGLIRHVVSDKGTALRKGPLDIYIFSLSDEDQKSIEPGCFERHWGIFTFDGRAKYPLDFQGRTVPSGKNATLMIEAKKVQHLPRRWCVLNPEGDLSLLGDNINYACTYADCTPLMYGGSCNDLGGEGNASYAFNSYYQLNHQIPKSCYFDGLAKITKENPSTGTCEFKLGIESTAPPVKRKKKIGIVVFLVVFLVTFPHLNFN